MITDDQLVALLKDAHTMDYDRALGSSFHQCDDFDVYIEDGVMTVGNDSFYGVPLDVERLRAGVEALIQSARC